MSSKVLVNFTGILEPESAELLTKGNYGDVWICTVNDGACKRKVTTSNSQRPCWTITPFVSSRLLWNYCGCGEAVRSEHLLSKRVSEIDVPGFQDVQIVGISVPQVLTEFKFWTDNWSSAGNRSLEQIDSPQHRAITRLNFRVWLQTATWCHFAGNGLALHVDWKSRWLFTRQSPILFRTSQDRESKFLCTLHLWYVFSVQLQDIIEGLLFRKWCRHISVKSFPQASRTQSIPMVSYTGIWNL